MSLHNRTITAERDANGELALWDHKRRNIFASESALSRPVREAWARRVVACVNACRAIPTEALEGRVVTAVSGEAPPPVTLDALARKARPKRARKPATARPSPAPAGTAANPPAPAGDALALSVAAFTRAHLLNGGRRA